MTRTGVWVAAAVAVASLTPLHAQTQREADERARPAPRAETGSQTHQQDAARREQRARAERAERGPRPGAATDAEAERPMRALKSADHELTPEALENVTQVLRDYYADDPETLKLIGDKPTPEFIRNLLRRQPGLMPLLLRMAHNRRTDPDHYKLMLEDAKLERKSRELARQYRTAREQSGRAQELRRELQTVVHEHFSVRQRLRERELQKLEEQVARLRQQLEHRKSSKSQLTEQRVKELVQHDKKAEW